MRGDKFIGGIGAQSATVFAGRVGPQTFKLRNRWHFAMTVGSVPGFEGYLRPSVGALEPQIWAGQVILRLGVIPTDILVVDATSDPFVGVDPLLVTLSGWSPISASWNAPENRYDATSAGLEAWMAARVGQVLGVRFARGSVGA